MAKKRFLSEQVEEGTGSAHGAFHLIQLRVRQSLGLIIQGREVIFGAGYSDLGKLHFHLATVIARCRRPFVLWRDPSDSAGDGRGLGRLGADGTFFHYRRDRGSISGRVRLLFLPLVLAGKAD